MLQLIYPLNQNPLNKTKGNKGGIQRIKNKKQNGSCKSNHDNNIKCERIQQLNQKARIMILDLNKIKSKCMLF